MIEVTLEAISLPLSDGSYYDGSVSILIDGEEYSLNTGDSYTIPELFSPGEYTYYIYTNHTDQSEAYVSYDAQSGSLIAIVPTVDSDGNIDPNPNEIYFGTETIEISEDATVVVGYDTSTLGRDLIFQLTLDGDAESRLVSFTAKLNGVAQQWDCLNDTPYGSSASVLPTLTKSSGVALSSVSRSSGDSYYLEGAIHLLGVSTSDSQILTIELGYEDEHPTTHIYEKDVTDMLSDFNNDKSSSMILSSIVETPTQLNPEGSIGDWKVTEYEVEAK